MGLCRGNALPVDRQSHSLPLDGGATPQRITSTAATTTKRYPALIPLVTHISPSIQLGIAFEIVGLVGLFTIPVLTLVVLGLQSLWVLAAAITLLVRTGVASDATGGTNLSS